MSSTGTQLKSKYESSSIKIKQLYDEFSNMRKCIYTPQKNNKSTIHGFKTNINNKNQQILVKNGEYLNFQMQSMLKNAMLKFMTVNLAKLDTIVDERLYYTQQKLQNITVLFLQLAKLYKIKSKKLQQQEFYHKNKCQCQQFRVLLSEVQAKYNTKINGLVANYQKRIIEINKEIHDNSTQANSKKSIEKQLKQQLLRLEDRLTVKDREIENLKAEQFHLHKILQHHRKQNQDSKTLIQQLIQELEQKQGKINKLLKNQELSIGVEGKKQKTNYGRVEGIGGVEGVEGFRGVQGIEGVERVRDIADSGYKMNNLLLDKDKQKQKQQGQFSYKLSDYLVDDQDNCKSQKSEQNLKINKNSVLDIDLQESEPMRKTQYFNADKKKQATINLERRIKYLQSQLQLIHEQNKLLKTKKDRFQDQCKQNQSDEQRFQIQGQILKDQIKVLTINIKNLDQCAVLYFKNKKISEEELKKLSPNLKFKNQYIKKYPFKKEINHI